MDATQKLLSISKVLEKMIDHTVHEIFGTYRDKLLIEKNTYIIPAVWGVVKDGELDDTQKEIYAKASKLVADSISAFYIKDLKDPQAYAIRYLVNRNLIYSISHLIELTKSQMCQGKIDASTMLANIEPMGNA